MQVIGASHLVLTESNDKTLFIAPVARMTSSNSGTLPPTKPVFPPCVCHIFDVKCSQHNYWSVHKTLCLHTAVWFFEKCKAAAVHQQHDVSSRGPCLRNDGKLILIAVLQDLRHLLCSMRFQGYSTAAFIFAHPISAKDLMVASGCSDVLSIKFVAFACCHLLVEGLQSI